MVDHPLEMAACWIALEDVQPGSGELIYVPGSHRFPDFDFGDKKHWDSVRDGITIHDAWSRWLYEETARRGLTVQKFLPRKGDILIWHADLAHGGSPITRQDSTRKSLIGHFCPRNRIPNAFRHFPARAKCFQYKGLMYTSAHYDLAADVHAPASQT